MEVLRQYLENDAGPDFPKEAIKERVKRLEDLEEMRTEGPAWLTLEPSPGLENWAEVLEDELQLEGYSCRSLMSVVGASPYGPFEGNRILRHLLKDSSSSTRTSRPSNPNRWMQSVCEESLRAQHGPDEWSADHQTWTGLTYVKGALGG